MRLLVIAAALAVPASSSAAPSEPAQTSSRPGWDCPADSDLHLAGTAGEPVFRRLGELPPGNVVLTVMREVDGCIEPVIVRYGVGADGEPAWRSDADEGKETPQQRR